MILRQYIQKLQAHGRRYFTSAEITENLDIKKKSIETSLRRLKSTGEIVSPARGFYLIIPPEFRIMGCLPPEYFVPQLMQYWNIDYYVGLLSAAKFHGAAHQQPQIYQIIVARNRKMLHCGRVKIEFIAKKNLATTPVASFKTPSGYIAVSTAEATAKDLMHYFKKSGGLNQVITVIDELSQTLNTKKLVELASKSSEVSWSLRLGFTLEFLGHTHISEALYSALKNRIVNYIALCPYEASQGYKKNVKWKIIINSEMESDI